MKQHKKGFTLIELLVVMSIIALLLSILVPALGRARAQAMILKDSSQVKAIADGWTTWTSDHDGSFPIPGLEQRLQDPVIGDFVKGAETHASVAADVIEDALQHQLHLRPT